MSQHQQDIGADRRVHHRFDDSRASLVELGGNNNGIVLNISEGGMAVLSTDELDLTAFQHLRFQAPEFEHWMEIAAEIAWISDSRKQAGIRFKGLSETARTQLRAGISIATVRTMRANRAKQAGAATEVPQEVTDSDSMPASVVATDSVTSIASESEQPSNEANTDSLAEEIGEDEGLLPPEVRLAAPDSSSREAHREINTSEEVISPGESKPFPSVPDNAWPSALTPPKSALSEMRFRHLLAKSGVNFPSYASDGSIRISNGKWAAIAAIAIVASLLAFLIGWVLGDPARMKLPH